MVQWVRVYIALPEDQRLVPCIGQLMPIIPVQGNPMSSLDNYIMYTYTPSHTIHMHTCIIKYKNKILNYLCRFMSVGKETTPYCLPFLLVSLLIEK